MRERRATWIVIACWPVMCFRCAGAEAPATSHATNTTATEPEYAPLLRLLSDQNHLNLVEFSTIAPRGYEHFNPSMLDALENSRRIYMHDVESYLSWSNPGAYLTSRICFTLQTTWRRGRLDVLNYFKLRDIYVGTADYEIGYVTHVIISKYMDTLEILEIVRYHWLGGGITTNRAPSTWMWFMYTTILENSRTIIALCNMLHEIKRKYKTAISDSPWDELRMDEAEHKWEGHKGGIKVGIGDEDKAKNANKPFEEEAMSHRAYIKKLEEERRKKQRAAQKRIRAMMKFGQTLKSTKITRRPKRYWVHQKGYDYGWSIEKDAW